MKALLVGEYREGQLQESSYELIAFAKQLGAEPVMFLAGSKEQAPSFDGTLYLADASVCGEFNPAIHKQLLLDIVEKEKPDVVALSHSSYGWDLAPRLALALQAGQVSEVVEIADGGFVVPVCNAKLRRRVEAQTDTTVVTVQAGAFSLEGEPAGTPSIEKVDPPGIDGGIEFAGYEEAEKVDVDLSKAEIIVTAGRGLGKKDNVEIVAQLASALGGELGASRPVVDSGWVDHSRQVGTTGQTVAPKVYMACGVSGAIQHLAGMKKSGFVVAINKDKDAPIGEVADVLVVADVLQFVPALVERIKH